MTNKWKQASQLWIVQNTHIKLVSLVEYVFISPAENRKTVWQVRDFFKVFNLISLQVSEQVLKA
jgi:hypothetical protein